MTVISSELRTRLAKLVRMLGASEGEAAAALSRIKVALAGEKLSFTDLGDLIEHGVTPVRLRPQSQTAQPMRPSAGPFAQQAYDGFTDYGTGRQSPFADGVDEFMRAYASSFKSPQTEEIRRQAERWRKEKRKLDEAERRAQEAEAAKNRWAMQSDKDIREAARTTLANHAEFLQPWEVAFLNDVAARQTYLRAMRDKVGEIVERVRARRAAA